MTTPASAPVSVRQFTILVFLYTVGTTILVIPAGLAAVAKQDAWIASLLGLLFNLAAVFFYLRFSRSFPDMTLAQYYERVYGRWLGKLFTLSFVFFSFIGAATVLFYLGNFINTQVMPKTPIQAISILFILIVAMGLRLGLEAIAKAGEILFPWIVLLFFILIACLLPQVEVHKLLPMFEADVSSLLKGAVSVTGTSALPFIVFLMFYPAFVANRKKAGRGFVAGTIAGGLFIAAITFLSVAVLGADISERQMYPSFSLAKRINIGNFFARVEILIAAIWFITVYFKILFYLYGCVAGLAQLLGIGDYRALVLPMGMILVVYSQVVYPNVVYAAEFDRTVWIPYILTYGLVIPIATWAVGRLRHRMRGKPTATSGDVGE
ncbi:endospore germination permease [Cohnella sp. CFH 77786]|uniref:GerAB/ArcD/ProY family transporter n=1 Tax=Cohnella sp. CFH 77786 TaxID=2662265 RepID=UPI001C60B561|nr:endospore germination permease [Cohnella sp. CFH 77786]